MLSSEVQDQEALAVAAAQNTALARVVEANGQVWDTTDLQVEFDVRGFQAPYVVVLKRSTGEKGSLQFTHRPRFYFDWVLDA